jgi:fibronectin type 3 domain-containing protein
MSGQDIGTPTNLTVVATAKGINTLRWTGNASAGKVLYEIWRLNGDTASFEVFATTSDESYADTTAVSGEYYNYKVCAVMGGTHSAFSNVAVVYGAN